MSQMEAPSNMEPTLSQKLSLLWENKKPMMLGILALISLLFFAAVFCIVYFLIIKPKQGGGEATVSPSHIASLGLTVRHNLKLI